MLEVIFFKIFFHIFYVYECSGMGFWNLKSHLPVTHFLQYGHTSKPFSNSAIHWWLSIQICEPMGAILIQTTTEGEAELEIFDWMV